MTERSPRYIAGVGRGWSESFPEEWVLELALKGGTGFTEAMRAPLVGCSPPRGRGRPREHPLLRVSSKCPLGPVVLSTWFILGGREETQPARPAVSGTPFSLKTRPDLFPQAVFSIYSCQVSKVEIKPGSIKPIFKMRELEHREWKALAQSSQLQAQGAAFCRLPMNIPYWSEHL